MENIGDRIRNLRKRAGLSQAKLAELVGRNPHTIKDYEAGRVIPSWEAISKIAEKLGVSQRDLMDDIPPVAAPAKLSSSAAIKKYLQFPDDVVDMAQSYNPNDEVWDVVRAAFRNRAKTLAKNSEKKNHA